MPQLLHPSFLRLGRRTGGGPARPARDRERSARDRARSGRPTRATRMSPAAIRPAVSRLSGPIAATVLDRAIHHERVLGLAAAARTRTVDRVVDRRGHRTYDEVTDLDAARPARRPVPVRPRRPAHRRDPARLADRDGHSALASASAAVGRGRPPRPVARARPRPVAASPTAVARTAGRSTGTGAVDGVPVPGDGLRVQLWPDGSFHGLAASDHAAGGPADDDHRAARRPRRPSRPCSTGGSRRRPAATCPDRRLGPGLGRARTTPSSRLGPTHRPRSVAWPGSSRSARVARSPTSIRGLEVAIDAGDGSLLGGDVLR